ncbi:hypothetical protein [Streptomyces sp. PA03-2a]|nr:hypothetical protein [Streptomyces sp. PA03-2a]MDX2733353.1 hypothetical protein [Streptomyces sp. PA03-2a]
MGTSHRRPVHSVHGPRPGEIVPIDSTRLDVMAVLDDGVVAVRS